MEAGWKGGAGRKGRTRSGRPFRRVKQEVGGRLAQSNRKWAANECQSVKKEVERSKDSPLVDSEEKLLKML